MTQYRIVFHHKISPTCVCHHSRGGHRRLKPASEAKFPGDAVWGEGECVSSATCRCTEYVLGDYEFKELPAEIVDHGDRKQLERALQQAGALHSRLDSVRREPGKVVCFPKNSIWHSLVIETGAAS